jgi:hypothetical protein
MTGPGTRIKPKIEELRTDAQQARLAQRTGQDVAARLAMGRAIQIEKLLPALDHQVQQAGKFVEASKDKLNRERIKLEQYKSDLQIIKDLAEVNASSPNPRWPITQSAPPRFARSVDVRFNGARNGRTSGRRCATARSGAAAAVPALPIPLAGSEPRLSLSLQPCQHGSTDLDPCCFSRPSAPSPQPACWG